MTLSSKPGAPRLLDLGNGGQTQIDEGRKNIHLGLFATVEEAAATRRAAELEHFGEVCP